SSFSYNNEAVQLLAGIIRQAAGVPVDDLVQRRLFGPLGIQAWAWDHDRAGNVKTYAGLRLGARDLARIGQLLLREGQWNGQPILPADWLLESTTPRLPANQASMGFLWWIRMAPTLYVERAAKLEALAKAGFS